MQTYNGWMEKGSKRFLGHSKFIAALIFHTDLEVTIIRAVLAKALEVEKYICISSHILVLMNAHAVFFPYLHHKP